MSKNFFDIDNVEDCGILEIPFYIAMHFNLESDYVEVPILYFEDLDVGRKVDDIMSCWCVPHIFITELTDDEVSDMKSYMFGSYEFVFSKKIEKWILLTPYRKNAWHEETLVVRNKKYIKELIEYFKEEKDNISSNENYIEIPVFYDKNNIN